MGANAPPGSWVGLWKWTLRVIVWMTAFTSLALPTLAQQIGEDLTNKSLEDLMKTRVISVSKKEEQLSRTASAVFVITQEDVARSGATNIPDLLRLVPGLSVAQIDANNWAISARGLTGRLANKLLVLIDGRTVYVPTFGGVFWDVVDLPLEDIERIEVIRGPGGSIWGANAVNGVINIITKKAAKTPGAMVVAGGGNVDQGFGTTQYGGSLGKEADYRVYAKYFNQVHLTGPAGQNGGDGWHVLRGGFRMDTSLSTKDTLALHGDLYSGRVDLPTTFDPSVTSPTQNTDLQTNRSGGYVQSVWNHVFSSRSDTTLQLSYDHFGLREEVSQRTGTFNADFQHHFAWGGRQDVVWGFGYRYSDSHSVGNFSISFSPANLATQIFSGFVSDEIAVLPERLYLTVGTKLEHNYYTGFSAMPSGRLAWAPNERHMLWAAISHVHRTPSVLDVSVRGNYGGIPGPGGTPILTSVFGNPKFQDEELTAYEAGYRIGVGKRFALDFAAYYNSYDDLETTEPGSPFFEALPPPPHLVLPFRFGNLMHGETHGMEASANWKVTSHLTLSPGYAFERIHMHLAPTSQDTTSVGQAEGSSPVHSAQLRSHVVLAYGLSWDAAAYFVDRLTDLRVPSYTRVDTGLSWKLGEKVSLGVMGQNLVKDRHEEFVDYTLTARTTLVGRGGYAKVVWQF